MQLTGGPRFRWWIARIWQWRSYIQYSIQNQDASCCAQQLCCLLIVRCFPSCSSSAGFQSERYCGEAWVWEKRTPASYVNLYVWEWRGSKRELSQSVQRFLELWVGESAEMRTNQSCLCPAGAQCRVVPSPLPSKLFHITGLSSTNSSKQ